MKYLQVNIDRNNTYEHLAQSLCDEMCYSYVEQATCYKHENSRLEYVLNHKLRLIS